MNSTIDAAYSYGKIGGSRTLSNDFSFSVKKRTSSFSMRSVPEDAMTSLCTRQALKWFSLRLRCLEQLF